MADVKKYVSLDKLTKYDAKIKGVISAGDEATLAAAKKYADDLGVNYDAAGAASTAEANAKAYTDEVKQWTVENIGNKANNAYATANTAARDVSQAKQDIDALETYVGTIPETATATNIVAYVQEKTAGIATDAALSELTGRVTQAEADIDAIEADYLKAADKTELEGEISAVQTAVDTEKGRAEGKEAELAAAIKGITDDYLKAADKTELQGNIDTLTGVVETLSEGVDAEKVDGVKDLIKYVEDHGTEVTGMQEDIADNASAIEGVAGRMTTAEGKITAVEGAVATKVEQSVYDAKVAELAGADAGQVERIAALEAKFGGADGSVEDMIADAKQEAIDAAASAADTKDEAVLAAAKKYADDEDAKIESRVDALEGASATHALASDLTALDGRVTTAEGEIDTLQSEMDAVEALAAANKAAHEANAAAIALKASQADLEAAVARIAKNETDIASFVECSEEEINALFA